MSFDMYRGVFGGIRLWGDHLFKLVGIGEMLGVQSRHRMVL